MSWFESCCSSCFVRLKPETAPKKNKSRAPKTDDVHLASLPLKSINILSKGNNIPQRDIRHEFHLDSTKDDPQSSAHAPRPVELGQHEDANGKIMEDRVVTKSVDDSVFFGVYDGHGSGCTSDKATRSCVDHVSEVMHDRLIPIIESGVSGANLEAAVQRVYKGIEREVLSEGTGYHNGTTACSAVIKGNKLVVVNLGDSQALVCRGGVLHRLSNVHRPSEEKEKTRIEEEGGRVILSHDGHSAEHRLESGLGVSRSFGDFGVDGVPLMSASVSEDGEDSESTCDSIGDAKIDRMSSGGGTGDTLAAGKARGLSAVPECHEITLEEDDEFVLIACDGVFDVMNGTMVMQVVRRTLRNPEKNADDAATELLRQCKSAQNLQGSIDNLSVVVALLKRPAPIVNRNSALRLRKETKKQHSTC